ncbi:rod shape-determining protein RodA [Patescibacteria group bacterium]|nr:rod shape-determining protein RodA [Patescibacteria group bacterium]
MNLNFVNKLDKALLFSTIALILIGLIVILSTSYSSGGVDFINFNKQLYFALLGIIVMIFVSNIDYRSLKNYTGIFYLFACFILIIVLFYGSFVRGTSSWFSFGMFNVQPAEFVKIIIIIVMAKYLAALKNIMVDIKKMLVSAIYVSLPVLLILLQPDFGSAIVVLVIWFSMLLISGLNKSSLYIILCSAIIIFVLGWSFFLADYQKNRITTFINPQIDLQGAGYNVNQSIIAIGSGQFWGKGLGHGSQSQLNFLPEKHTDFIFAVIAEELGFIGVVIVLILFAILFYRIFKIIDEVQDNFGKLLIIGIAVLLGFHVLINIGMNLGIMPVTGIPLPFISYGGSSLFAFLMGIGIVQSVYLKGRNYELIKEEQ